MKVLLLVMGLLFLGLLGGQELLPLLTGQKRDRIFWE